MSIPIPEGSVVITPTEVYREMQATHQAVQSVATKVDGFVSTQLDHENRIRSLERRFWVGMGVVTAISAGASGLIAQAIAHH